MNIHKNARLTPLRREEMALSVIAGRLSQVQAARLFGVSAKIVARWVERFKAHGRAGMTDPVVAARVVALGRQRWTGQHIALEVGVSPAAVSRVLRSAGLSRLKDIAPTASDTAARAIHKRASRVAPAGPRRLPRRRNRLLCQPRRHRHPRYDRQRLMLPIESVWKGLPQARPQACQNKALHAQDHWKGGALHPDGAARMGLRCRLSNLGAPRCRTANLAPPLQLASPSQQPKVQNPNQPSRPNRG
mgnify:FL=1